MSFTTSPSTPQEAALSPGELSPNPEEGSLEEHTTTTLLGEGAASWHPRPMVTERRRENRIPCNFPGLLVALSDSGQALDLAPWKITVKDLSRSGVGIAHLEPLPHRLTILTFETAASEPVRLVVRLKWCRFKRTDLYESGGQILRILKPGE